MKMNKEQLNRLRTTPVGWTTRIEGITLEVVQTARFEHICQECEFQEEDGAKYCVASKACLAKLRPDKRSVYFRMVDL